VLVAHAERGRAGWQERLSPGVDEGSCLLPTSGAQVRAGRRHISKNNVWHNEKSPAE